MLAPPRPRQASGADAASPERHGEAGTVPVVLSNLGSCVDLSPAGRSVLAHEVALADFDSGVAQ